MQHSEVLRASLAKATPFSSFRSPSLLAELICCRTLRTWKMLRCPKLEGQDVNTGEYIHSDGALKETSDSCCRLRENARLWRAKSVNCWWILRAGRRGLGQLISLGEWGGCPSSQLTAHGADRARSRMVVAGGSPSPKPLARDKWLIHGVLLGPLHCNLLAWHQRERLCCLHPLINVLYWPNSMDFV